MVAWGFDLGLTMPDYLNNSGLGGGVDLETGVGEEV